MKVRGGRPGLPAPNSPHGLCGRKAKLELELRHIAVYLGFDSPAVLTFRTEVTADHHIRHAKWMGQVGEAIVLNAAFRKAVTVSRLLRKHGGWRFLHGGELAKTFPYIALRIWKGKVFGIRQYVNFVQDEPVCGSVYQSHPAFVCSCPFHVRRLSPPAPLHTHTHTHTHTEDPPDNQHGESS